MAPWLRAHTEHPEDLSSVPAMHVRCLRPPKALLRGTRYLHTCTLILTQIIKINNIFKCCFSDILFISGGGEHVCEMRGRVGVSSLLRVKLRSAVHRGVHLLS